MNTNNILDDIISGLQPDEVPVAFIVMAKVIDLYGNERVIHGKELEEFLADPDRSQVAEARVILDVRKIRVAIITAVNTFFDDLHTRVQRLGDSSPDSDGI